MCCIHYGLPPSRHTPLTFWHHPPQHSLPVNFDTVARELSPRMQFHRFVSWKGDVPFIIQMLIALREERVSALLLFFTSTSTEACCFSAAENSHYHLLNLSPHQHYLRICSGEALTNQNKQQQLGSGVKKTNHDKQSLFIDIHLLVFTRH